MEKAAVETKGLVIPLIDFFKFLNGNETQRQETANAILHGFQTAGFIYLKNIPITSELRQHVFDASARFFKLPLKAKLARGWTTAEANRGYTAQGREKTTQLTDLEEVAKLKASNPDIKESFEIGRDTEEEYPNQWPDEKEYPAEASGFRATMNDFFDRCKSIHEEVMRAIAVGLGIDPEFFHQFVDEGDNTLRLLHYPSVKSEVFKLNPGQVRAGAHSDYGSITLLFQDAAGGLQVMGPSGEFVDATPIENTVVVNAGDLLARWSNDTIKSTVHRVIEPPRRQDGEYPPRYSIAYFCNPNFSSQIEAIPGTYAGETARKYEGVNSGKYLVQRLTATY